MTGLRVVVELIYAKVISGHKIGDFKKEGSGEEPPPPP